MNILTAIKNVNDAQTIAELCVTKAKIDIDVKNNLIDEYNSGMVIDDGFIQEAYDEDILLPKISADDFVTEMLSGDLPITRVVMESTDQSEKIDIQSLGKEFDTVEKHPKIKEIPKSEFQEGTMMYAGYKPVYSTIAAHLIIAFNANKMAPHKDRSHSQAHLVQKVDSDAWNFRVFKTLNNRVAYDSWFQMKEVMISVALNKIDAMGKDCPYEYSISTKKFNNDGTQSDEEETNSSGKPLYALTIIGFIPKRALKSKDIEAILYKRKLDARKKNAIKLAPELCALYKKHFNGKSYEEIKKLEIEACVNEFNHIDSNTSRSTAFRFHIPRSPLDTEKHKERQQSLYNSIGRHVNEKNPASIEKPKQTGIREFAQIYGFIKS